MRFSKKCLLVLLVFVLVFSFATNVSAEYSYVQNDVDNPTKFSIDKKIADGFSTDDIYIGTTKAYLGDKADGKTAIFQDGLGLHPADLLITNGEVGIVLAVGTADPWGYPGGSILDAGRVTMPEGSNDWKQATFGKDTALTVQYLFNGWDEWAPVNCGMVYFDLVKYNFDTKKLDESNGSWAVQVERKYTVKTAGVARDFDVISYYTIDPGAEYAYMYDTLTNKGTAAVNSANQNMVVISNKGGVGIEAKPVLALTAACTFNWEADASGDPKEFATTLISPGQNASNGKTHEAYSIGGAPGYREIKFKDPNYAVGETRLYESYLMIDDQCSWQNIYDFWADYNGMNTFHISGTVVDANGAPAEYPVIIVTRGTTNYGWVMGDENGNYSLDLPKDTDNPGQTYNLKVELTGAAPGEASSNFTIADDGKVIDLEAGAYKVPVTFHFTDAATGEPAWGRVSVGTIPVASFTGKNYFLADNSDSGALEKDGFGPGSKEVIKGQVTALVAPGPYTATCYGEGYGFSSYIDGTTSGSVTINGNTTANPTQDVKVSFLNPTPTDWYAIDNHHHGQRMDAFSEPEVVSKAQVTAGLDVLTLDDHEFVMDNWPVYQWGKKMDTIGYMPSEEVTASWAHFDIMPLSVDAYEQNLDRDQKNIVVNTNDSLKGILDQGHLFGNSIGANHPTYSYGMLLADNNKTVPGGLVDDFDGLETQASANYTNEAMAYWTAFIKGTEYRNLPVERPHYIWGSTDIHQSGTSAGSGSNRSYVFLEDGEAISEENYDKFGLEFARSEALGHSFNSNGVYIIPATKDLMYGNTYETDKNGNFTAKFDISALDNITKVSVFSSLGNKTASSGRFNNFKYLWKEETFSSTKDIKDFEVRLEGIRDKEWIAIGAETNGKMAFTNPIWINGTNVKTETITKIEFQNPPTLPTKLVAGETLDAPTSAGILITTPWSVRMVEDWAVTGANFGDKVEPGKTYTYTLTYDVPLGYKFSEKLTDGSKGFTVSSDGSQLVYSQKVKASGTPVATLPGLDVDPGANGIGTVDPTDEQWDTWIADANGKLDFDFSDDNTLKDLTGVVIKADADKLKGTALKTTLPNGTVVTIPGDIWAEVLKQVDGSKDVDLSIIAEKDGSVSLTIAQDGKQVQSIEGTAAITVQIPYTLEKNVKADGVIAELVGKPGVAVPASNTTLARSWYDETSKTVVAKIYDFGQYKPAYVEAKSFGDTAGKWMDDAAKYLRVRNVAQGVGSNHYEPNRDITRAEFTTLIVRMLDIEAKDGNEKLFLDRTDIPSWANQSIKIAASHGIILGDDKGYFLPNHKITRQDMFLMTSRALETMHMMPATIPDTPITFTDFNTTSAYAKEAIEKLAKLKLVNGDNNNKLNPRSNATRGECAQFLYNVLLIDR
ncbi:MAG TPA: S-layer homology domain-containing protein [Clostridiales bacterium]|nr:S-layer homology domain-containing protein [Clostridiales bacterium]